MITSLTVPPRSLENGKLAVSRQMGVRELGVPETTSSPRVPDAEIIINLVMLKQLLGKDVFDFIFEEFGDAPGVGPEVAAVF